MIERDLEQKICDKIKALNLDGLTVIGLWQPDSVNLLKDMEEVEKGICIVSIPPATFTTFGISETNYNISIVLTIRLDACPTGQELLDYSDKIYDIFKKWNLFETGEELNEIKVEELYNGGLQIVGGSGPEINREAATWTVQWNLELKGSIIENLN